MTTSLLSPYAATQVVNKLLAEKGISKTLPPQMLYTYVREDKKYIKASKDESGKIKIAREDLMVWFDSYVEKLQNNIAKKAAKESELVAETESDLDENQLELDLDEN